MDRSKRDLIVGYNLHKTLLLLGKRCEEIVNDKAKDHLSMTVAPTFISVSQNIKDDGSKAICYFGTCAYWNMSLWILPNIISKT